MRGLLIILLLFISGACAEQMQDTYVVDLSVGPNGASIANVTPSSAYYIPDYVIEKKAYELRAEAHAANDYYHLQILDSRQNRIFDLPLEMNFDLDGDYVLTYTLPRTESDNQIRVVDEWGTLWDKKEMQSEGIPHTKNMTRIDNGADGGKETSGEKETKGPDFLEILIIIVSVITLIILLLSKRRR